MPGIRQLLGARGERAAARFLRRRHYAIVARNYRCPVGEVDLIALDGATIVFVEVKTRSGTSFGAPAEAVTRRKQRQIVRVATYFLTTHRLHGRQVRYDVVGVRRRGRWGFDCELFRNAFLSPWG